jgi:hypothetical protein
MRTKGLSAIVAVVIVAGCGGRASSKPPTEPELLVGLKPPPLMVPGLQTPIGPAAAREAPTPRECGAAWNQRAPRRTLRWVAAHSARHADVTLMEAHVGQQIGGTRKQYVLYNCMVGITVAPTEIVFAAAPPRGSGVWAGELLTYRNRDTVTQLTKRFNATVGSDGKIHLG